MNIYRFQEVDACSHYVHAEMNALLKAPYNTLEGSSLYVYREGKMGELRMSRPCPACFEALKEEGVSYIYYTDETGFKKEKVLDK
jgi:deoxycytidylate deaminase